MNNRMMTYRDSNYNLYTSKTPENRCIRHDVAYQAGAEFETPYTTFESNRLTRFVVPEVNDGTQFCFFPFDDMYAIMAGDLTELSNQGKQPAAQRWPDMAALVPFDLNEYPMYHLDQMAAGWEYTVSNIRYEEGMPILPVPLHSGLRNAGQSATSANRWPRPSSHPFDKS